MTEVGDNIIEDNRPYFLFSPRDHVLFEIDDERVAQDEKWGEQNHPDGTSELFRPLADMRRSVADHFAETGELTWADILLEETYEALAELDPAKLRTELIQVAAVAVAWVEAIDRRC